MRQPFAIPQPIDEQHAYLIEYGMTQEKLHSLLRQRNSPWEAYRKYIPHLPDMDKYIQFISSYAGRFSYRVMSGPMQGKRVEAREWGKDLYRKAWSPQQYNLTEQEYERDIVSAAGCVSYLNQAVTEDVLLALQYMAGNQYAQLEYRTGCWYNNYGWIFEERTAA